MLRSSSGSRRLEIVILGAAVCLGAAFPISLVVRAWLAQIAGFPLDDTWIHLTYARNLWGHHSLSYFPGDPATLGTTSPLYTLLLSLGFALTDSEKLLGHLAGLFFQICFLIALACWASRRLGNKLWAAAAVMLVALDGRIGILAASGMETSFFLFAGALAFYARASLRPLLLGGALGISVWIRPDGLILMLVMGIDLCLELWSLPAGSQRRSAVKPWLRGGALAGGLVLTFFGFNVLLGGSLLPNTFAAKTTYYAPASSLRFLGSEVLRCFAADGWVLLLPFILGGMVREALQLRKPRQAALRPEAGWALALVLAYTVLLPFSHVFNRYLVPVLPAMAVLGLASLRDLAARLTPERAFSLKKPAGIVAALLLLSIAVWQLRVTGLANAHYQARCQYFRERHEKTGHWLAAHTSPDAVIATHDVGAIAYYSGRRIIDLVGLVQPEAIAHLHQPDYVAFLRDLFQKEKVTHLAVLRNWLEIDNTPPLFLAAPQPEWMEVYRWDPAVTHLVPPEATRLNALALQRIRQQDPSAEGPLRQSLALDDQGSRTWYMLGVVMEATGRREPAVHAYRRAIGLFPGFLEARRGLARLGK